MFLKDPHNLIDKSCHATSFETYGGVVFEIIAIIYIGLIIYHLAESYLIPSVLVMCNALGVSEELGGMLFLAIGASSPDLAVNIYAVLSKTEIGMGNIIGSSVYNLTVSIFIILFLAPKGNVLCEWTLHGVMSSYFMRDFLYYFFSLLLVFLVRLSSTIQTWQAIIIISIYPLYLFVVFFNDYFNHPPAAFYLSSNNRENLRTKYQYKYHHIKSHSDSHDDDVFYDDEYISPSSPTDTGIFSNCMPSICQTETISCCQSFSNFLFYPITHFFSYVFFWTKANDTDRGITKYSSFPTYLLSSLSIICCSILLMLLIQRIGCVMNLNQGFMGLTFLAIGSSLPDTISMGVAAYIGKGHMAISGILGSNIFIISLGLGIPWMIVPDAVQTFSPHIIAACLILIGAHTCLGILLFLAKMDIGRTIYPIPFLFFLGYTFIEIYM